MSNLESIKGVDPTLNIELGLPFVGSKSGGHVKCRKSETLILLPSLSFPLIKELNII